MRWILERITSHARWLPLLCVAALSAVFIARVAFVVDGEIFFSLFDDAMISMHYARNLAEGHGLVWNAGEAPVEGYSNFLWTAWMALLHCLSPSLAKASLLVMLSGAVLLVLDVVVVRRIVAELAPDSRLAGPVACWLVALDHSLAFWTLRGFEIGLITLEISLAVHLALGLVRHFSGRRLAALALVMALGVLTRDDTLPAWLVVSGFVWAHSGRGKGARSGLFLLGAVAVTLAVHTVVRQRYYGAPLPNTYFLKLHGIPALLRWRRGTGELIKTILHCLAVPLALAAGLLGRRPRHPGAWLLAALFAGQCLYSVHVGGDIQEDPRLVNRFVACGLPSLLILSALGLEGWSERFRARRVAGGWVLAVWALAAVVCAWNLRILALVGGSLDLRLARMVAAVGAAVLVTALARGRLRGRGALLAGALVVAAQGPALLRWATANALVADRDARSARYGLALGAATSAEARIAVTSAGAIPYFSRRRAIDLFGVCDPVIARTPARAGVFAPGHNRWDQGYSIGELRPDVVAQVVEDSEELLQSLQNWGYLRVGPEVFVLQGSKVVDGPALQRAACVVPWHAADVWGYFGEPASLWGERWRRECQSAP